jgi:4-hydroxyphenylpyruvate dioxygenase-like putative hemolysin
MNSDNELRLNLKLPAPSQIGVVVADMDKAISYYSTTFGLGPFTAYEFIPEKHWFMEEPSYHKSLLGKAMWGNIELELIKPLEGRSLFKDFLETRGEGVQHLGFNTPNYDEMFEQFKKAGFKPLMRAESYVDTYKGFLKACSFDTRATGGIVFEIMWKSWLVGGH